MFKTLFSFFTVNHIKNKRIFLFLFLGLFPVLLILLIGLISPLFSQNEETIASFFPNFTFLVYLHFLVPILSLFLGTGIIADEVENKRLPYLLIQPIPRYFIAITKYIATTAISSLIILTSLIISYITARFFFSSNSNIDDLVFLLHGGASLILGCLSYSMLFFLLGGILRHPIIFSILFVFGWEKIITYVPGNAKYFTIMNYLQATFPDFSSSKLIRVTTSYSSLSDIKALFILLLIMAVIGTFSSLLLSIKEYPSDLEGA